MLDQLTETYARTTDPQTAVADGYGIVLGIERGQLVLSDGIGRTRRVRRWPKTDRQLQRIMIVGNTGTVSLDAVAWCADRGVTIVQCARDASGYGVRMLAGKPHAVDARLSRGLVLAGPDGPYVSRGLDIVKQIIGVKLQGQSHVARSTFGNAELAGLIDLELVPLDAATDFDRVRMAEGRAASFYWEAWRNTAVATWKVGGSAVPPQWKMPFTKRSSALLTGTNRCAADPVNALLNFSYSAGEIACVLACLRNGLDPSLGLLHVPDTGRYSLALDLLETIRPDIDAHVLSVLRGLRAEWFTEVKTGTYAGACRLLPPLTHMLFEQSARWEDTANIYARKLADALSDRNLSRERKTVAMPARSPDTSGTGYAVRYSADVPAETRAIVPDELWRKVDPLITPVPYRGRRPVTHPRRVLAGMMWMRLMGGRKRDVGQCAGIDSTTLLRFARMWDANGDWERVRPIAEAHILASADN